MSRSVVAEYSKRVPHPDKLPRSADDLHSVINAQYKRYFGREISVYLLEEDEAYTQSDAFLGLMVHNTDTGPKVFLNPHQNHSAMRLALVQESFQALLEDRHLISTDLVDSIRNYVEFRESGNLLKADTTTFGEIISEIAAMETLFPYNAREEILSQHRAVDKDTIAKIASEYALPARWVRFYLRDEIMKQLAPFSKTEGNV